MANKDHLGILEQGIVAWNKWRESNHTIIPDLSNANLENRYLVEANLESSNLVEANLRYANLSGANLKWAHLSRADMIGVNLVGAKLIGAIIYEVNLSEVRLNQVNLNGAKINTVYLDGANLAEANLSEVDLFRVSLRSANLRGANLKAAKLTAVDFTQADLGNADFNSSVIAGVEFGNNDLSVVRGLNTVNHLAPSSIGIGTLYLSNSNIPEVFLRGCGVPEEFIVYIPSLVEAQQAVRFYSCFISYNHKDEEFAKRLHSRMRDVQLRVWFAPEDVKGGEKLREQIDRAIQMHDRLLIVLSENSMQSKWVVTEIRKARKVELAENRRKLFPIRLVDYKALQTWECFDSDTGEDLAVEVREYFIPDFSNWKEGDDFELSFDKLLKDLRAEEKKLIR